MHTCHIHFEDLKQYTIACLKRLGVCDASAEAVADGLCTTSLMGVDSHGIKLLPHYLRKAEAGRISKNPNFEFTMNSNTAGKMNAHHAFGHHAGVAAMKRAIELAKNHGLGAIAVGNSSHFGAAGYFALQAAKANMIGLSFTHADSLMLSTHGKRPFFGTNPIAFCAPVEGEEPLYLDMATTTISWNQVMISATQNKPLKPGWAVDQEGDGVTDASKARALHPIGDYKGFALGMMVEILCSLLSEMPFGRDITSMYKTPIGEPRYLGHFFMAMNIEAFTSADRFKHQLARMMHLLRSEPQKGDLPVMAPGDPQKKFKAERLVTGIPILHATWEDFVQFSTKHDIPLPKQVKQA